MSQSELARRIDSTLSMVGKLERGEREMTFGWLERISEALGVSIGDLFDFSEEVIHIGHLESKGSIAQRPLAAWELAKPETASDVAEEWHIQSDGPRGIDIIDEALLRIAAGSVIVYRGLPQKPSDSMFHRLCVLSTGSHGKTRVGYPMPGSQSGRYHILTIDGSLMENESVHSVFFVSEIRFD